MFEALDYNLAHYLDAVQEDYRRKGCDCYFEPFFYSADFLPLALSTTASRQVQIQNDSDFLLCQQMFVAFTAAGASASPNVLVTLVSNSSARLWQDSALHILNCFGTGAKPFTYYKPHMLPSKSSFTVTAQNLSAAADVNLRLTFAGAKAYLTPHAG